MFGTQAKTNKSFRRLVLAEASVADLKARSDYEKGLDKEERRQRMSGTKVLGVFIFFLPDTGIVYSFFHTQSCRSDLKGVVAVWQRLT